MHAVLDQGATPMLITLIVLLTAVLSWLFSVVSQIARPLGKPPITAQDPSTLTLALIGVGTLGIYFAISRRARQRQKPGQSLQFKETPATNPEEQMPSRGAA
jgi:hypothetical protein